MGRLLLLSRLVIGDIRRRRLQSALLLIMIVTTTTTLTLGFALRGATDNPWAQTHALTRGPDVVAMISPVPDNVPLSAILPSGRGTLKQLTALAHAQGVAGSSGPYPLEFVGLSGHGVTVQVEAEGRGAVRGTIDRPLLTTGSWVRPGAP